MTQDQDARRRHSGKLLTVAAAAVALSLTAHGAVARDVPTDGVTIDDIVAWLHNAGYQAEVVRGDDGKRHISTSSGGTKFGVYFYDCKTERCGSIQFAAGFATHGHFDISRMNQWNSQNRWGRGYYDSVNDPWVEMDVDLTPGGTYELLDDELATWNSTLARFTKAYDLN